MKLPSTQQARFSAVPQAEIQRASFDRSHGLKTTLQLGGILYPIFVDEALPGDTFNVDMTGFCRMSTPIYPVMDNLYLETFFFAVPYRLVWDNFKKMMGEQTDPGDSTDYLVPQWQSPGTSGPFAGWGATPNSLADQFGLPTKTTDLLVSDLPRRAYYLIWNEWFRDQNILDSLVIPKGDATHYIADPTAEDACMRRAKRHDYFTSCLPWPQKGPGVEIPISGLSPIQGIGTISTGIASGATGATRLETGPQSRVQGFGRQTSETGMWVELTASTSGAPSIYADLARTLDGGTINQLRQAFQIQKLLERDARGGTRYTELIRAHFGVTSPDARLQRPEYLGGGSTPINVQTVHQTSEDGTTPLGTLGGIGTATASGHGFTKSFTEHTIVIGLVNVRADLTYQQGINRMWSRRTRYDFYWPALAHIGEQAVLRKEIYATNSAANNDLVFGYQERYAEYRYKPSFVTGKFRSNATGTLDAWHLALNFADPPTLNPTFIRDNPPISRVLAVPEEPAFISDFYFNFRAARPMPLFGTPGLVDHF